MTLHEREEGFRQELAAILVKYRLELEVLESEDGAATIDLCFIGENEQVVQYVNLDQTITKDTLIGE